MQKFNKNAIFKKKIFCNFPRQIYLKFLWPTNFKIRLHKKLKKTLKFQGSKWDFKMSPKILKKSYFWKWESLLKKYPQKSKDQKFKNAIFKNVSIFLDKYFWKSHGHLIPKYLVLVKKWKKSNFQGYYIWKSESLWKNILKIPMIEGHFKVL